MGTYKNKAFTLRIDQNTMEKTKGIAEKEGRTTNKQIEYMLNKYIDEYEKANGGIAINIGRDNNGNINL